MYEIRKKNRKFKFGLRKLLALRVFKQSQNVRINVPNNVILVVDKCLIHCLLLRYVTSKIKVFTFSTKIQKINCN